MKKALRTILSLSLLLAMVLSVAAPGVAETAPDFSSTTLVFATDQVGSSNYNVGIEMSKYMEEAGIGNVDIQPISPGGMGAPYLFAAEQCDISFVNGAPARWALETGTLGKPPATGYMAIAGGLSTVCAVNLMTNSFMQKHNVSTIEEALRQKLPIRIGSSNPGSMDHQVVQLLLDYMQVTKADIESWGGSWVTGGGSDMSAMITDGQLDYYLDHTSPSSSTMTEIALTSSVTFMQWEEETVKHFVDNLGFQRVTLPSGSFRGLEQDIINPGTPDCLFVKEDLSEDLVYTITKALCENRDNLVTAYATLAPFDPATAWEAEKVGGNALHPGAVKYYTEAGYMK